MVNFLEKKSMLENFRANVLKRIPFQYHYQLLFLKHLKVLFSTFNFVNYYLTFFTYYK